MSEPKPMYPKIKLLSNIKPFYQTGSDCQTPQKKENDPKDTILLKTQP